jgi:hypothetical protein
LDAFGLLDEYEASLFTRSFHHASATVQDELVQVQADWCTDETFMADEEPQASLRNRTLESVARTIERETSKLAPLATIGRTRPATTTKPHRFTIGWTGQLWRAAAFALAGAVIVMSYFMAETRYNSDRIIDLVMGGHTDAQVKAMIGRDFTDFLNNPSCRRSYLAPVKDADSGVAAVYILEGTQEVFLLGVGIPQTSENSPYTLLARAADGTVHTLKSFVSNGTIVGLRLDKVPSAALAAATWEITNASGIVVLRTA